MPRPSAVLKMTALERRDVPALVTPGDGWADARNLSLSFAPDGARVGSAPSDLNAALDAVAPRAAWQREVLRAFQSWAAVTNIHVGLVGDAGAAFGAAGEMQGDPRFGDVRVGGRAQGDGGWAHAAFPDRLSGTWAGDVLFNTALPFAVNPPAGAAAADLYTIALHEAGPGFGLEHSMVPGSALSETYEGPRAGLALTDVAAVQAAYGGARTPDRYEGLSGNGSLKTATPLAGFGNLSVVADVTTAADADVYRFSAQATRFSVRLQTAGLSLLTARVTVYDAHGRAVGAAASADPARGDLEVAVEGAVPGQAYYARVEAASGTFGVGRYRLAVDFAGRTPAAVPFAPDGGTDDGIATATDPARAGLAGAVSGPAGFAAGGVVESAADADYYRLAAPFDPLAAAPTLTVTVRSLRADRAAPAVALFDAFGREVPVQVLTSRGDEVTVRLPVALPGATYFLRVGGAGSAAGNYRVAAEFALPGVYVPDARDRLAAGYLSPDAALTTGLSLKTDTLYRFTIGSGQALAGAAAILTVRDAAGRVVFTLTQAAGEEAAAEAVYLGAGEYTLTVTMTAPAGADDAKMWVMLDGEASSDPAGTYATTTSTGTTTTSTSSGSTTTTSSKPTTSTSTTMYAY